MINTLAPVQFAKGRQDMSRQARILIAEDDAAMRELLADALRVAGHEVVPVPDGARLLDEAVTSGRRGPVDVVITDIRMPGVSGLEALGWLRDLGSRVPVVIITAFGDPSTHAEARRLGARAVLDKPFEIEALTRLVSEVLECPDR